MVNVAFICEDDAGKKIIESQKFNELLVSLNLKLVLPVYNAKGKGNLIEENVLGLVSIAIENGATTIFLLVDMDADKCITLTKQSLIQHPQCNIMVCKKAVEAWFLADSETLSALLKRHAFFENPEEPLLPYESLNYLHKDAFEGRGISKTLLPKKLILEGFSIVNASQHPNCNSAAYFVKKLQSIAQ